MVENEILDNDFNENKENFVLDSIDWWEKKRGIFNILLLAVEVLVMIYFLNGLIQLGAVIGIVQTIIVNIIINVFYSLGWGLEVFLIYYFKEAKFSNGFRNFLYYLGLIFTLFITAIIYADTLSAYYYQLAF